MEGINPRYPEINTDISSSQDSPDIQPYYDWFKNERNRTLVVRSKVLYDKGVWDNARVQRIGEGGELYSEMTASEAQRLADERRNRENDDSLTENDSEDTSQYFEDRFNERWDDD
jgi:hypothetical protein